MSKIIVYVRPWNSDQFEHLAHNIWPENDLVLVSEHKSVDQGGLSSGFYRNLNGSAIKTATNGLDEAEIANVIQRCRLLRAIQEVDARKMIKAMHASITCIIDTHRPVAALSMTIDSYIIHLLYLVCKKNDIHFIGLVPTFVNGYFRVSALGERNKSREVSAEETIEIRERLLQNSYKPGFIPQTARDTRKRAQKNWLRNLPKPLWFRIRRWFTGDRLNYHYYASQVVSVRYWSAWPQNYVGVKPLKREALEGMNSKKPLVFLPLQMSPEATVDYWSSDVSWIDYETRVLSIIDTYKDSHKFIVKEHPNVLGFRTRGFYKRLRERQNCILIAAEMPSNVLLNFCDAVVICTGTVGFEAALRGIPVFSDSNPFHLRSSDIKPIIELENLIKHQKNHIKITNFSTIDIVRYLIEGLLPGKFINDGSWNSSNITHINNNEKIAKEIKNYLLPNDMK